MKNTLIVSICILLTFIFATSSGATETLDCFTKEGLIIRMHINSSGEIADLQIRTHDEKIYEIVNSEFKLIKFGWKINGFVHEGNFIHLITQDSKSGFPRFELNVKEDVGSLQIQGEEKSCECEWGYK